MNYPLPADNGALFRPVAHEPSNLGGPRPRRAAVGASGRARTKVYLNGKFYSGVLNGVHRTADRLVRELDALSGSEGWLDFSLLLPRRPTWAPPLRHIRKVEQRLGHRQLWEQFILPFRAADGVLVNLANLAPLAHGRKLTMVHDAQFVISPESYPLKFSLGYRALVPWIAATSARVLTVSEYARDSLAAFHVAKHRTTEVIYNGADHILAAPPDPDIVERLRLTSRPFALLFGTAAAYKNVQVVFEAFNTWPPGVRLVIVGASRLSLLGAGLNPPSNAIFAGKVGDPELRALYEAALALLFPSRTEGFGLPPVEAMLCGCPVIAAPGGAIPEICRDAILYADIFAPSSWSEQIVALRSQPGLRQAKIVAGRRRAESFTWKRAGVQLLDQIRALA